MSEVKKVINNSVWIIACRIMKVILGAVVSIVSARLLGASSFGLINYASSITSFVSPLVLLGFNSILVKELVSKNDDGEILGTAIISSVICSVLGIGVSTLVSYLVSPNDKIALYVTAIYSVMLVFHATELIQYWFQAKYRSKTVAIVGLIAYTIVSVYKVCLLIFRVNIYWYALSHALDYLLISGILLLIYVREGNPKLRFSKKVNRQMIGYSFYYSISAFMVNVFTHVDSLMIKTLLGNAQNGIYSVAVTCSGMFTFVFVAILEAMRPYILEGKAVSEEAFEQRLKVLYSIFIYLGLTCGIAVLVSSKIIIGILYGMEYSASADVLKILIWNTFFSCIGGARDVWILTKQKQKYLLILNTVGVISNIALNAMLIPRIGILGAAISTVITQFISNVMLCFVIKDLRRSMIILTKSLNPKVLLNKMFEIRKCGRTK